MPVIASNCATISSLGFAILSPFGSRKSRLRNSAFGTRTGGMYEPVAAMMVRIIAAHRTLRNVRSGRHRDLLRRILRELVHQHLDCFLERRIATRDDELGTIDDFDVRRDADAFHGPLAGVVEEAELRRGDRAAVHQSGIAADADEAAPRARADERADLALVEVVRQRIAARR